MKAFMEEYGVILVAAIVILVLVAAANGIGTKIVSGIQNVIDKFTSKMSALSGNSALN